MVNLFEVSGFTKRNKSINMRDEVLILKKVSTIKT